MISHGFPDYLECSTKGDARFSAFNARIRGHGNRSIESIYQGAKKFLDDDGKVIEGLDWRAAKGRKAINQMEVSVLYKALWREYIQENPELLQVLLDAPGLSDRFGQPGHACQATELWDIRCNHILESLAMDTGCNIRTTSKRAHSASPPDKDEVVIDVDRSNPVLGNRSYLSNINDDVARYKAISDYRAQAYDQMKTDKAFQDAIMEIENLLLGGAQICLHCWCAPKPCHGEVIGMLAADRVWRAKNGYDQIYTMGDVGHKRTISQTRLF